MESNVNLVIIILAKIVGDMRLMDIVNMKNTVAIVMLLMQLEIHGKERNLPDIDVDLLRNDMDYLQQEVQVVMKIGHQKEDFMKQKNFVFNSQMKFGADMEVVVDLDILQNQQKLLNLNWGFMNAKVRLEEQIVMVDILVQVVLVDFNLILPIPILLHLDLLVIILLLLVCP